MDLNPLNIVEHAKEIAELIRKYNDIELYQKIVDLRDEIFALREENLALRAKVKELEEVQAITPRLSRDGNVYYLMESDGTKKGPFCMTCWDADKKLVNLLLSNDRWGRHIHCNRCNSKK